MAQIGKICLIILAALTIFLAGWIAGNWNKKKEITKAVKKAISDTQKVHGEVLKNIKADYEEKLRKKDDIIQRLMDIINRLLTELNKRDANGFVVSLTQPGKKLSQTLNAQLNKLNAI